MTGTSTVPSTRPEADDLLATIVAATRRIVEVREQREPLATLAARALKQDVSAGRFRAALTRAPSVGNALQGVPEV